MVSLTASKLSAFLDGIIDHPCKYALGGGEAGTPELPLFQDIIGQLLDLHPPVVARKRTRRDVKCYLQWRNFRYLMQ